MIARPSALVALLGAAALATGCGSSRPSGSPGTHYPAGTGTVPAAGSPRPCPDHRGLRMSVAGISCTLGGRIADAMGPDSARARFSVRGFRCVRPPTGPVRCTRGGDVLVLSGGD